MVYKKILEYLVGKLFPILYPLDCLFGFFFILGYIYAYSRTWVEGASDIFLFSFDDQNVSF